MAATVVMTPMQVRDWLNTMEKQVITNSVWGSFSNRVTPTTPLPNSGDLKIPNTVIAAYGDKLSKGSHQLTIPSADKLKEKGQGGSQPVEGNEERIRMRYAQVYYNVHRKGIALGDESVDGDISLVYGVEGMAQDKGKDYFTELSDYNFSRGLLEGADEYLTEMAYWGGTSLPLPPVSRRLHPTILFRGINGNNVNDPVTGMAAWDADQDTYLANVIAKVAAQTAATSAFNKQVLDNMIWFASRNIAPAGDGGFKWVILLSDAQAQQLLSDASPTGWTAMMQAAAERGEKINKAITGALGVYRETLIMVNPRNPIFDTEAATADVAFQYVTPWGDNRVPVTKAVSVGGDSVGTMEVAICMGRTALGHAVKEKLTVAFKDKDYEFTKGTALRRKEGVQRMDFFDSAVGMAPDLTGRPSNWSSFIFLTGTPTISF